MIRIDERLPEAPLESEVVLHVRRHLRASIRAGAASAATDLAHLFGFPRADGRRVEWREAAEGMSPIEAGAAVASRFRPSASGIVTLGHDPAHVAECREWLLGRRTQDAVFQRIKTSDLPTLLELSKARDLATAKGWDGRFLPVLIQGETGTGKELLAESIHELWKTGEGRPKARWQVIQVAGLTKEMISDELFGHARGAFTGAETEREGRLETAHEGTLFIDEVGDLPLEAQLRLLRFLQTQIMSRLGENKERQLSVRIIAATWHDLEKDVAQGTFRKDLLFRLRVGSGLFLRPLREREGFFDEIVPELLQERRSVAKPLLTRSAREALAGHAWEGNLRELVGVLDEALAVSRNETIRLEHLPPHLQRQYLKLPPYGQARALGSLLDETEDQPLTEEHIAWRIAGLKRALAESPLPPANEQFAAVAQFISLVDDSSEEHRQTVENVKRLLELERQYRHADGISAFWSNLLGAGLPPQAKEHVAAAQREAEEARNLRELAINALRRDARLESTPWLRLLKELSELPLLKGVNGGELTGMFLAIFNLLKLFASPEVMEQLREDARTGGFPKIRERVTTALREFKDGEEIDAGERKPPSRRTTKEWRDFAAMDTLQEAMDRSGHDPKTIKKYLRKNGLPYRWKDDKGRKK